MAQIMFEDAGWLDHHARSISHGANTNVQAFDQGCCAAAQHEGLFPLHDVGVTGGDVDMEKNEGAKEGMVAEFTDRDGTPVATQSTRQLLSRFADAHGRSGTPFCFPIGVESGSVCSGQSGHDRLAIAPLLYDNVTCCDNHVSFCRTAPRKISPSSRCLTLLAQSRVAPRPADAVRLEDSAVPTI